MAALFISFGFSCTGQGLQLEKLASDDNDEKIAAIAALVAEGDPKAADVLTQAAEGEVEIDGKKVEIVVNNRVRGAHRRSAVGARSFFRRPERAAGGGQGARGRRRRRRCCR